MGKTKAKATSQRHPFMRGSNSEIRGDFIYNKMNEANKELPRALKKLYDSAGPEMWNLKQPIYDHVKNQYRKAAVEAWDKYDGTYIEQEHPVFDVQSRPNTVTYDTPAVTVQNY